MTDTYADDAQRYRLDSRIATGGMGEVWRATDTSLGREVAVKLLKAEFADDPTFRSRFETEARHAAALHHPGVAGVYDVGEGSSADGSGQPRPFLVMELVDGQPLSALLQAGRDLDPVAVRELLSQVGDALGAAHRAGIIHRDVKPANLIVTPEGKVKVTDFGIARAADGVGITRTGTVMGTPQYLSPEQAEGRPATSASDVYALGVVAFECLAGRRPFDADSPVATALAHIREPIPSLPASVPGDLAAVVRRSLSKDPAERYPDGSAFAAALRDPATAAVQIPRAAPVVVPPPVDESRTQVLAPVAAVAPDPTPTTSTTSSDTAKRSVWPIVAVVALLVALAVVVTLLATGGDDESDPTTADDTSSRPPATSSSPPSETPTSDSPTEEPTTEEPETYDVDPDNYVGNDLQFAVDDLEVHGLRVQRDELANDGTQQEGIVDAVNPSGPAEEGDVITVSYWGAAPVEPESPTESVPTDVPTTEGDQG